MKIGFNRLRVSTCLLAALASAPAVPAQDTHNSNGWVVIPVNEYGSLRSRAYPVKRNPDAPPVDAMLTRVDYDLQIRSELASGRANLTVDVVKDGWVRVPIPAGLLVSNARLEGKLLTLVPGAGNGQLSAMLSRKGRSVLALDVALPVVAAGGEERLSLPSSDSGITRASVVLGRQDVEVKVTGGLLSEKNESASESKWLAYGRANESLTFAWRRKTEDHHVTQPLRFRGALTQLLGLGEDTTSIYAEASIDIAQGAADKIRIQTPDAITVNQVLGATVADWERKPGELIVTFLAPVEKSVRFVISGETRLPRDGAIDIPMLRLLDAERDSGGVAVEVISPGEFKELKPQGLEATDAAELGQAIASRQSPSLAAFRLRAGPATTARSLHVSVARYTQQAVLTANIEEARYRVLMSTEGKDLVEARYAVRNNQRNFMRVQMPAGAVLWTASVAGKPVHPGQAPDGSLLLPLVKANAGEDTAPFAVEILYLNRAAAWADKGNAALTLPAADLPVSRTGLVVFYPPSFQVKTEQGTFRAQPFQPPSSPALSASASLTNYSATPSKPASTDMLQEFNSNAAAAATQNMVDRYRTQSEMRKPAAAPPGRIPFPTVGPSVFLVSELTAENQSPVLTLTYQKDNKGGVK